MIAGIKSYLLKKLHPVPEVPVVAAYDIWSSSYDSQPGNLMLELDGIIFRKLMKDIDIMNKRVFDIGCGTGRHWQHLLEKKPHEITGFDVSSGMLLILKKKFPEARTIQIFEDSMPGIAADSADCVVSTLTIAHLANIEIAIKAWARVLVTNGDLLLTDFHPALLAGGGRRSFSQGNKSYSVRNYVHDLDELKALLGFHGFEMLQQYERIIDEDVKGWYESQNALSIYNKFYGMPIIYGLHFKKTNAAV